MSEQAPVGVDLEALRDDIDLEAMARRFFSPAERRAWTALPDERRTAAGFACWTRKEAWAKAGGTGLEFPLAERQVWAGDDRPVRCGELMIAAVDCGPRYAAAVAAPAGGADLGSAPDKPFVLR